MRATPSRAARFLFRKKRTKLYLLFNRKHSRKYVRHIKFDCNLH